MDEMKRLIELAHEHIGRQPCTCEDTPEYIAYRERLLERFLDGNPDTSAFRLFQMYIQEPFEGDPILTECLRCLMLEAVYEDA